VTSAQEEEPAGDHLVVFDGGVDFTAVRRIPESPDFRDDVERRICVESGAVEGVAVAGDAGGLIRIVILDEGCRASRSVLAVSAAERPVQRDLTF